MKLESQDPSIVQRAGVPDEEITSISIRGAMIDSVGVRVEGTTAFAPLEFKTAELSALKARTTHSRCRSHTKATQTALHSKRSRPRSKH